jgi:hypothetical protein
MGAKTCMLVYSDGDPRDALALARTPDPQASGQLAARLYPGATPATEPVSSLLEAFPRDGEVFAGSFPGVEVLAASDFGIDQPSKLARSFLAPGAERTVHLHAMHSVVDWCAFAVWKNGALVRSLSVAPDSGVLEDLGERLPFELGYWNGDHPAVDADADDADDDYPLPFHPLELGEAALFEFFGYQLEGSADALCDAEAVQLLRFRRARPWWKLW